MTSSSAPSVAAGDPSARRALLRFLILSVVAGVVGDRLLAAGVELSDGNPLRLDGMLSIFVGLIAGPWWGALTGLMATARTAWETQSPLVTLLAVSEVLTVTLLARRGWVPVLACGLHGFDGSRAAKVLPGMSNLCKGTRAGTE